MESSVMCGKVVSVVSVEGSCQDDTEPGGKDSVAHRAEPGGDSGCPRLVGAVHSHLPAPPPRSPDYQTGELHKALYALPVQRSVGAPWEDLWENPYETLGGASHGDYIPMGRAGCGIRPAVGQNAAQRHSLWKRTSLLFISLWLITLICLITTLGLYLQSSGQNQCSLRLFLLQLNTSTLIPPSFQFGEIKGKQHLSFSLSLLIFNLSAPQELSSPRDAMVQQKTTASTLIAALQMEVEDLDHFYSTALLCIPNYTIPAIINKMVELSRKDSIVIKPVWRWVRQPAVDVTLDPDTAHPSLILSEDGKQVRLGGTRQDLPDTPKRFTYVVCVLGKEGFSSGRHYWEVEMKSKTDWTVGVAMRTAKREGPLLFRPRAGYWTVRLKNGEYLSNRQPPTPLRLREKPSTVGVYVDYERGQVSFYNAEARSHIYSFTGYTFTERLYPLFRPGISDEWKNSAALVIPPVS
ncbi:hypothetical protein AGOR_G00187190 [Albula goreensis]|uniref:B30.2/SPRY domain-containing protein n=1 Tax=Albula goreensis TaxID=1534307 RepID=A0A8T3CWH5_9TELE|nr:hypothetical protein AGOR_G00187190 [Albula goreensis]